MLKMTATCLIILVLATVGQAGTFANCVAGYLLADMDDPTEYVTDLLTGIVSDSVAEDIVTALVAMDCSAVDATIDTNSLSEAEKMDILHVALMEDIHTVNSANPPAVDMNNRRFLLAVTTAIVAGSMVAVGGGFIIVDACTRRRMRRALSTEDVIITPVDLMAGCANVGGLSDICNVPIGDLSIDFSTALCGGPSETLECDVSLATMIGVMGQMGQTLQGKGMETETSLALKNDRLRRTNRALVKRFKELSMN